MTRQKRYAEDQITRILKVHEPGTIHGSDPDRDKEMIAKPQEATERYPAYGFSKPFMLDYYIATSPLLKNGELSKKRPIE